MRAEKRRTKSWKRLQREERKSWSRARWAAVGEQTRTERALRRGATSDIDDLSGLYQEDQLECEGTGNAIEDGDVSLSLLYEDAQQPGHTLEPIVDVSSLSMTRTDIIKSML